MAYQDLGGVAREMPFDLDALHERLRQMTDAELLSFGKEMHALVYPLSYGFDGRPVRCAFSIQLDECRAEWRRRHP
ncbi:MAG: hypothetical protein ABR973_06230 [Candidatus Acidiferrales bacterium]|jgi:hypothetical protein